MRRSPRLTPLRAAKRPSASPAPRAKRRLYATDAEPKPTAAAKKPAAKKTGATRVREEALLASGHDVVVGVDEAGRGPLAGPVCAAAYCLPAGAAGLPGVEDSKTVSEDDREALYEELIRVEGCFWSVSTIESDEIDDINILQATLKGMRESSAAVVAESEASSPFILVDGNRLPADLAGPAEAVVKGDAKMYCIAAASILAKVTRDRLMRGYHEQWPVYNFEQHKGYPTKDHMAAVFAHGATPIHRLTFAPLKHMSEDELWRQR